MPYAIVDASYVPVTVACVVGAARFKRLPPALRYLAVLIFFETFLETLTRILAEYHQPNLFLFPLDTMVEFGLLAWMYRWALWPSAVSRWLPAVVAVFSLASLLSYADAATLYQFNTLQRFAESLLLLSLVLLFFYKLIRELAIVHLERDSMFWVSVGLLLYFSGNVFIFVSSNYVIQHSKELSLRLWDIHALLYMVLYSIYAWALWINPSTTK